MSVTAGACPHCGHAGPAPLELTAREREVLGLVADGLSGRDIGKRLGLASNTVAQHLASVRRKYGVHTSRAAVDIARRAGELLTTTKQVQP